MERGMGPQVRRLRRQAPMLRILRFFEPALYDVVVLALMNEKVG